MKYLFWATALSWQMGLAVQAAAADPSTLGEAVALYASFDQALGAERGGGGLALATRYNHPTEKGQFIIEKGIDGRVYRVAKNRGVHGGALEATDVLPRNGRIFFPARGNIAFKKGGWGGAVSVWINTDPDKLLKTRFCDPVQITQKGATNGGIWFDFNDAKPRDMRMGVVPVTAPGQPPFKDDAADAPLVPIKAVGFKAGDWHHVVLSWQNLDTGRADATARLYVDGKLIGTLAKRDLRMDWDLDKTGIYLAVNYLGLLDELAIFNRPLTAAEVGLLHKQPGILATLK